MIFSAIFHVILFGILLYFGFFTPLPLPQEQGVLVDFGTTETGRGKVDPPQKKTPPKQQEVVQQDQQKQQSSAQPETSENPAKNNQETLTQDYEKTVAINEAKEKEALKKAADEKKRLQEKRTADSLQQIEDEKLAELKRAEKERHRQDSIRKAEEEAQIAAIDSRAKNLFNNSGQTNTKTSDNQGNTGDTGNVGSNNGTSNVSRVANGGGEGIKLNLKGHDQISLVKPAYEGYEEGVVVVEIKVNQDGKVIYAKPGVKGTMTPDQTLWEAARKAAMSSTFTKNPNAKIEEVGTITYKFMLN